jgi:hypothetical protein
MAVPSSPQAIPTKMRITAPGARLWERVIKSAELPGVAGMGWNSGRRKFGNDLPAPTPMAGLCHMGG